MKIQVSLWFRIIWSESSLGAFRITNNAKCLHADDEDSDQTAEMRSLIWAIVKTRLLKYTENFTTKKMKIFR